MLLADAHDRFVENVEGVSLEEALDPAGGHRSVLGIVKHVAGWSAVYRSFAFDLEPRHWDEAGWPRGLRDRIEPTRSYLQDVTARIALISPAWYTQCWLTATTMSVGHRVRPQWMSDEDAARFERGDG